MCNLYIIKRLNKVINDKNMKKQRKIEKNKSKQEKVYKLNVKIYDLLPLFIAKYMI